jgi:hypothetical protein
MRKLFRMKYEPCSGRCYAPDEVIKLSNYNLSVVDAAILLERIIKIHEPACGNENLSYGMDYDEETKVFISSFQHFGMLDIFSATDGVSALNKLIDAALEFFDSEQGKELLRTNPGKGHDVCEHGEANDLRKFSLKFSGLNEEMETLLAKERSYTHDKSF